MNRRTIATIALTGMLLAGTGTFAQRGPGPGGEGFMKPGGHHGAPGGGRRGGRREVLPPDRFLKNRIGLSEEQLAQVGQLREDFKATVEPLREQGRAMRKSLRTELESDTPSAETAGHLVISGRDVRDQIRAARENVRESFRALLTPEQVEQLEEFRQRGPRRGFGRGGRGAF